MATLTLRRTLLLSLLAAIAVAPGLNAAGVTATEQQVKAVFVRNFSHFVDWPPESLTSRDEPFVIGVMGSDAFTALLEQAVRNERVDDHPIQVRRLRAGDAERVVHILFVDASESARLEQIVGLLKGRSTLIVSDSRDAMQHGAMIQLVNVDNRIRLRINVESTRAAGLTLSSNLLRSAEIVGNGSAE